MDVDVRIVDWDEFKHMPPGTVYWEYQPEIFYDPGVITEFLTHDGEISDFRYVSMRPDYDRPGRDLFIGGCTSRWGMYDYDQQFCVFDDDDVSDLIRTIRGCV